MKAASTDRAPLVGAPALPPAATPSWAGDRTTEQLMAGSRIMRDYRGHDRKPPRLARRSASRSLAEPTWWMLYITSIVAGSTTGCLWYAWLRTRCNPVPGRQTAFFATCHFFA